MKYHLIFLLSLCVALTACGGASRQYTGIRKQLPNMYIDTMEKGLNTFIMAEMIKRKVPVQLVTSDSLAELIMTGYSEEVEKQRWYHTVFGSNKDKNIGGVSVLSSDSKAIIWASEAGDRSIWWGNLRRGGMRKVAERITKNFKKFLEDDYLKRR